MFLESNGIIDDYGFIIVIIILLIPYFVYSYMRTHKSEKKVAQEMAKYKFIGSFKLKFSGVYGSKWGRECADIIQRNKYCYAEVKLKEKIIIVHYEEEIDKTGLRNLLAKIGYVVEIVK